MVKLNKRSIARFRLIVVSENFQRVTFACQMIVDAPHYQRTPVTVCHFADFIYAKPSRAEYSRIQRPAGIVTGDGTSKGKAEEDSVIGLRVPAVNTQHPLRHKSVAGFLQGFTDCTLYNGFIRLKMSGWLIEQDAITGLLLNQKIPALIFDDGCNRNIGFPDHVL